MGCGALTAGCPFSPTVTGQARGMDQSKAPVLDALAAYHESGQTPFTPPGHNRDGAPTPGCGPCSKRAPGLHLTFMGLVLLLGTCTAALLLVLRVATHNNALVPWVVGGVLDWYLLWWFALPLWARIRSTAEN